MWIHREEPFFCHLLSPLGPEASRRAAVAASRVIDSSDSLLSSGASPLRSDRVPPDRADQHGMNTPEEVAKKALEDLQLDVDEARRPEGERKDRGGSRI